MYGHAAKHLLHQGCVVPEKGVHALPLGRAALRQLVLQAGETHHASVDQLLARDHVPGEAGRHVHGLLDAVEIAVQGLPPVVADQGHGLRRVAVPRPLDKEDADAADGGNADQDRRQGQYGYFSENGTVLHSGLPFLARCRIPAAAHIRDAFENPY